MKRLTLSLAALAATSAYAQQGTLVFPVPPKTNPPPPKVYVVDPPPPPLPDKPSERKPVYVYQQQFVAPRQPLVPPEQAQMIVNHFKETYSKIGNPRLAIFVNRELVAVNPAAGSNQTSTAKSSGDTAAHPEANSQLSIADKQTVRDVERLFGHPFRAAGASLVDQHVAAELTADKPPQEFIGTGDSLEASKDREALQKVADTAIEVLISSKNVVAPTASGGQTIAIPDIEATAIRLKDAKIIGQAASSEITSRVPPAMLANYDVRDITEATALALMEDMTTEAK
jgi:hypothetical protein